MSKDQNNISDKTNKPKIQFKQQNLKKMDKILNSVAQNNISTVLI